MPFLLLVAAGAGLVIQNLLMARITGAASTILVALVVNAAVGLALLSALLLRRNGVAGINEVVGSFRPWFILPGLLGSFFVFASIMDTSVLAPRRRLPSLSQASLSSGWRGICRDRRA